MTATFIRSCNSLAGLRRAVRRLAPAQRSTLHVIQKKQIPDFEAGNSHPDFIVWVLKDGKHHIAFVDPKVNSQSWPDRSEDFVPQDWQTVICGVAKSYRQRLLCPTLRSS
jgi:hypothetical protein